MSTSTNTPGSANRRRFSTVTEFLSVEALAGLILVAAVAAALVWANVGGDSYTRVWSYEVTLGSGPLEVNESLGGWVTDGLMTVFFFVAGLEIKRELVSGELRDPRAAALPVLAALGGMVVPAVLFLVVNAGGAGSGGWGIPMATDIAFAVALVAALGTRVPPALKLFLLTLAIVDDIGAIVVIAVFYSNGVSFGWLLGALLVVAGVLALRRGGVGTPAAYVVPGIALWFCVLHSGVHATIAGVAIGLLTPLRDPQGRPLIERLEHRLHPWSSMVIVPVFALASAGVALDVASLQDAFASPVTWGVILGLVVGKPLGIVIAVVAGTRLGIARLPHGIRLDQIGGAGAVAGIGFTVSLLVADLSFDGGLLDDAKIGILFASIVSACAGVAALVLVSRRTHRRPPGDPGLAAGTA